MGLRLEKNGRVNLGNVIETWKGKKSYFLVHAGREFGEAPTWKKRGEEGGTKPDTQPTWTVVGHQKEVSPFGGEKKSHRRFSAPERGSAPRKRTILWFSFEGSANWFLCGRASETKGKKKRRGVFRGRRGHKPFTGLEYPSLTCSPGLGRGGGKTLCKFPGTGKRGVFCGSIPPRKGTSIGEHREARLGGKKKKEAVGR